MLFVVLREGGVVVQEAEADADGDGGPSYSFHFTSRRAGASFSASPAVIVSSMADGAPVRAGSAAPADVAALACAGGATLVAAAIEVCAIRAASRHRGTASCVSPASRQSRLVPPRGGHYTRSRPPRYDVGSSSRCGTSSAAAAAVGFFSSASARRMRAFCGFSSSDAMKPSSSSLSSTFRPTSAGRHAGAAHDDHALLHGVGGRVTAALVMLPLPTPAITMPLAPRGTAQSIRSAGHVDGQRR